MKPSGFKQVVLNVIEKSHSTRRMLLYLRGKTVVHFLHIGKTCGTAVKNALEHARSSKFIIKHYGHKFYQRDVPQGDKVIFIIRDPVSRYVSSFYSRQRMGKPRYHIPWIDEEEFAFTRFGTPNELAVALTSDDRQTNEAAVRAMKGIRHINSTYMKWFDSEEYFHIRKQDILYIGFQESLSTDFNNIVKILGVEKQTSLPSDNKSAHRTPDDADKYLSNQAVMNIRDWYKADYQFYNLCKAMSSQIINKIE